MMLVQRINAFEKLGLFLKQFSKLSLDENNILYPLYYNRLKELVKSSHIYNGWFTEENVLLSLSSLSDSLSIKNMEKWLASYKNDLEKRISPQKIAVIMAGNIPIVGFHDMLCVLLSGHYFIGKLSGKDDKLLPLISDILCEIEPSFKPYIQFTHQKLPNFDAVIATGSTSTSIYFNYYFSKYPHIIRRNRNSIAILNGNESQEDLGKLGKDIFQYFGLGCRNVSKLYVPKNYLFDQFYKAIEHYSYLTEHNKYMNNYTYYKSILLLNKTPFFDNGFLIVKEDRSLHSPIANIHYEFYSDADHLINRIASEADGIQCIVSNDSVNKGTIKLGATQQPNLWDYADGIDTLKFLISLN